MQGSFIAGIQGKINSVIESNTMLQNIKSKIDSIGAQLPQLANLATGKINYVELRKRIAQRLGRQRGKHGLALEALGWGTLAAILEAAFTGQELDVWS